MADPEVNKELELKLNVLRILGDPDIDLLHRVCDHDETLESVLEELKETKIELMNLKTQFKIYESYSHVTTRKLNDTRVTALTKHFQEMKKSPYKEDKSMTSGDIIAYFEDDAPEFLSMWELKNPYKTVADIRKRCLKRYPGHYSQRKSKHGSHPWILIYKD